MAPGQRLPDVWRKGQLPGKRTENKNNLQVFEMKNSHSMAKVSIVSTGGKQMKIYGKYPLFLLTKKAML